MRILALFCGAFSAGIFVARYLLPETVLLPLSVLMLLIACLRFALPGCTGRRVLLIGTALSLALGYAWIFSRLTVQSLSDLWETEQDVTMTLCEFPSASGWGAKVLVKVERVPGHVLYYGKGDLLELRPGVVIRDRVRLQDARRIRETDVTSFTSRGIYLLAYGRGNADVVSYPASVFVRYYPVHAGHFLVRQIRTLFPGDAAPFLAALLTGNRDGLSVPADVDISEAGLSHALAVSGMHCGFLIALIAFLMGRARQFWTAAAGIPVLIFYALLTGAKPSVIRACIMLSLLLLAPLFHRERDSPTALSVALFLILLHNPFAAASVSLQLSFASVTGLLTLAPKLYTFLTGNPPDSRSLRQTFFYGVRQLVAASFAASVGAIAFTAPLCAVYFGVFCLIAPLSNLLCLWAVGAAFVSGLAVTVVSFLCMPLAVCAAFVPTLFIRYILFCLHVLAKIPFHAVYFTNPFLKYWLIYAYAMFFAIAIFFPRPRTRAFLLAAALSCVTLCAAVRTGQDAYRNALDVLTLDVGQGQSVILASHGRYALVDCGSSNSWKHPGTLAADFLFTMGCRRLDALILTHFDSDHVNGVETLLARIRVKALYVPEADDDSGNGAAVHALAGRYHVPVHIVQERTAFGFGVSGLTIFPPVGTSGDNDHGLSILASAGNADLLITGDMGQDAEQVLLDRYALPDLEALVAGHHGSKYSTSDAFLSALAPEIAFVSVGANSYGHPAPETLRRLSKHHCAVYRTDLNGTVHLSLNPS